MAGWKAKGIGRTSCQIMYKQATVSQYRKRENSTLRNSLPSEKDSEGIQDCHLTISILTGPNLFF